MNIKTNCSVPCIQERYKVVYIVLVNTYGHLFEGMVLPRKNCGTGIETLASINIV
jgi:hypothetical protein